MIDRRFGACVLFTLVFLVSCADDDPTAPPVDDDAVGAEGGWVRAPGVAMLGVPPLMLTRPQEFVLTEAVDAPALPDHYEPLAVVRAGPDNGEYPAPLLLVPQQAIPFGSWSRWDLLRHDGDSWRVVDRFLDSSRNGDTIRVLGWTTRLGLLAVVRDTRPITDARGSILVYDHADVGPSGESQDSQQWLMAFFNDPAGERVFPAAVRVEGLDLPLIGDYYPRFFARLPGGTFTPGSELAVEVVGGEDVADVAATLTIPATPPWIISHVGGQVIARDEDLVLEWEDAAPGFVGIYVRSGDLRERFEAPDSGRLVIDAATVARWVEGNDDLIFTLQRLTGSHVQPEGWAVVELNHVVESKVTLVVR